MRTIHFINVGSLRVRRLGLHRTCIRRRRCRNFLGRPGPITRQSTWLGDGVLGIGRRVDIKELKLALLSTIVLMHMTPTLWLLLQRILDQAGPDGYPQDKGAAKTTTSMVTWACRRRCR